MTERLIRSNQIVFQSGSNILHCYQQFESSSCFASSSALGICVCVSCLVVSDSCNPIDCAHQAPLSMGFSRQEHWSGLPFPSPKGTIERKKVKSLSHVRLFATPWTVAYQAPASMEFSRQEYWNGLPFPSPFCQLDRASLTKRLRCYSTLSVGCSMIQQL